MKKQYDEVHREKAQPDGVNGAKKRARAKLVMGRAWPSCVPCYKPYELNAIIVAGNEYSVFLYCEDCANGRYRNKIHEESDLLG